MKNKAAMERAVETALEELRTLGTLTELDPGPFRVVRVNPLMRFPVRQYRLEGIGNVAVMTLDAGVMQMATVVVTPMERALPLLSADYIYMMGNRKSYIEFYDLVPHKDPDYLEHIGRLAAVREDYAGLEDCPPAKAWYDHLLTATAYKAGKKKDDETLLALLRACVAGFVEMARTAPVLDEEARAEKLRLTGEYIEGLVTKGGTSTNVFKKALGEEATRAFFEGVFFGTRAE